MSFAISHPDVEGGAVIPERALPAYAAKGWVLRGRTDHDAPAPARLALRQPAKSDSAAEWKTYAVATGMDFDEAMAMTRDELAEHYSPTPSAPSAPSTPKTAVAVKTTKES